VVSYFPANFRRKLMKSSSTVALDHEVEVGIKWFLVRKFIE
jgi:hypothetical protein